MAPLVRRAEARPEVEVEADAVESRAYTFGVALYSLLKQRAQGEFEEDHGRLPRLFLVAKEAETAPSSHAALLMGRLFQRTAMFLEAALDETEELRLNSFKQVWERHGVSQDWKEFITIASQTRVLQGRVA